MYGNGIGKEASWTTPYVVLTAMAALVAAVTLFLYVSEKPPGNSSAEAGFARDMAVHHAQAVEMASIVEQRTGSDEVRILANDIALTQQAQIGQMQGWLAVWRLLPTGTEAQMAWMGHEIQPGELMPGMATREEIASLSELPPDEMDAEFLRLMIEHHSSAIPMARAAIDRMDRPEVVDLAGSIAASQQTEIDVMQDMLERMGEEPVDSDSSMKGMDM